MEELIRELLSMGYGAETDARAIAKILTNYTGEDYEIFQCALGFTWGIEVKK